MNQVTDEVLILLNKISSDLNERLETIEKRLFRLENTCLSSLKIFKGNFNE